MSYIGSCPCPSGLPGTTWTLYREEETQVVSGATQVAGTRHCPQLYHSKTCDSTKSFPSLGLTASHTRMLHSLAFGTRGHKNDSASPCRAGEFLSSTAESSNKHPPAQLTTSVCLFT